YTFSAGDGLLQDWSAIAEDAPLYATARWLQAMQSRIAGRPRAFFLRRGGRPEIGLFGAIVSDPDCYEAFNAYLILLGEPPVFPLTEPAIAARTLVRSQTPAPPEWFPNLVVMFPGYQCFPVGPQAGDPAAVARLVAEVVGWGREQ